MWNALKERKKYCLYVNFVFQIKNNILLIADELNSKGGSYGWMKLETAFKIIFMFFFRVHFFHCTAQIMNAW